LPLVQLVFERGAFTATSTRLVASALAFFALGLPAHSALEIIVRVFYALHDTRTPVLVGLGAMALNVLLSLAFLAAFAAAGWPAHGGLALSNSLATTVEMAVLLALIRRRLGGLEGRYLATSLARSGLAAVLMGVAAGGLAWLLQGRSPWLVGGLGIAAGLVVYGGLSLLLGAPEPRAVWGLLRARRP
jgi:putative peptidoglycan lipid II flippase